MTMRTSPLERLARSHGIQLAYRDALGAEHRATPNTLRVLLAGIGVEAATDAAVRGSLERGRTEHWREPPRTIAVDPGGMVDLPVPVAPGNDRMLVRLDLEDGSRRELQADARLLGRKQVDGTRLERRRIRLPHDLPFGIHRMTLPQANVGTNLLAAPRQCYLPDDVRAGARHFGVALQLYGLRSQRNLGMGDFEDLAAFAELCASHGSAVVGINPLHALFPSDPGHFSPYGPSSRAFLNILYIAVDRVPEFIDSPAARVATTGATFQAGVAAARAESMVDYPRVAALKMPILELLHARFRERPANDPRALAYAAFCKEMGSALSDHALFDALHEHFFRRDMALWDWRRWPEPFRRRDSVEVRAFAERNRGRVEFFRWAQWEADRQLGEAQARGKKAGMALGLYQDIAVASHPGGSMGWSFPDAMIKGVSVGAPPDDINPLGQSWGAAAFSPRGLRATGYLPFRASVRASMRHAGAVRIDHVMSVQRLFCVPEGAKTTEGAYVHYPCTEMRGVIALESVRNRCMVIGEDLGTVPNGFRERMADAAALSYKVYFFEREHGGRPIRPEKLPRQALVTATTHDLPTLAGYWNGRDLDWRDRLNFYRKPEDRPAARHERAQDRGRLVEALVELGLVPRGTPADRDLPTNFFAAVYASLARSPSILMMVAAEDLVGEVEQPNLPGTFNEHPNWRRKLGATLEELRSDPRMAAISAAIRRERGPA